LNEKHLKAEIVYLCVYIQDFNKNEGRKSNCDDIGVGVIEKHDRKYNYDRTLKYAFPYPYAECFKIKTSSFLQCLIKWRELEDGLHIGISIKDK